MIEIAMSTLACPKRTLAEAVAIAEAAGCDGIELRTGGVRALELACDPFLSDESKTRGLLEVAGLKATCLATGVKFDSVVFPPVVGYLFDTEAEVRQAKRAIDLAAQLDCPMVRVFGFEKQGRETYKAAFKRIAGRLRLACDHARNTGTMVVVENGGDFSTAEQLAELVGAVDTTLIGASYDVALGHVAGDTPEQMTGFLRSKLRLVRVKDRGDDQPVQVGDGEIPVEPFVRQLERSRWSGPVVFEWEAAWYEGLVPIEEVLPIAVRRLCDWAGLTKGAMAVA
ncbi:MAG: sugar phosphate isomerase/epimerase [Phycisphaerales bacterium]|nr:sugar phosphate isomerase/epimerase [Phycisphaerales bacterium]MCB9836650.1 sugar phosphate isomerase/epimerase [Phycisphaera sp.]